MYDQMEVYETIQDAVDGLSQIFDLGRTRKARLKAYRYLDLNPRRDGADYCEITECKCEEGIEAHKTKYNLLMNNNPLTNHEGIIILRL